MDVWLQGWALVALWVAALALLLLVILVAVLVSHVSAVRRVVAPVPVRGPDRFTAAGGSNFPGPETATGSPTAPE
jgi:hypothetical protein